MKKYYIYIVFAITFVICSCNGSVDNKINRYIKNYCDFKQNNTCVVNLKEVLGVDYDTMFLFYEFTPLDVIKNCLNDTNFSTPKSSSIISIENNCYIFVLKNNNKIVLTEYKHYHNPNIEGGKSISIQGMFDSNIVIDTALIFTSPTFKVTKDKNNSYILECVNNGNVSD